MSDAWVRGERIAGILIPYNVLVEVIAGPDQGVRGWAVAVDPRFDEPLFLVEPERGGQALEVLQSNLRLVP